MGAGLGGYQGRSFDPICTVGCLKNGLLRVSDYNHEINFATNGRSSDFATCVALIGERFQLEMQQAGKALSFVCLFSDDGTLCDIKQMQVGSRKDIAFYERQLVELCFGNQSNCAVPAFCMPDAETSCPPTVFLRLSKLARTLEFIEMSMPCAIWICKETVEIVTIR